MTKTPSQIKNGRYQKLVLILRIGMIVLFVETCWLGYQIYREVETPPLSSQAKLSLLTYAGLSPESQTAFLEENDAKGILIWPQEGIALQNGAKSLSHEIETTLATLFEEEYQTLDRESKELLLQFTLPQIQEDVHHRLNANIIYQKREKHFEDMNRQLLIADHYVGITRYHWHGFDKSMYYMITQKPDQTGDFIFFSSISDIADKTHFLNTILIPGGSFLFTTFFLLLLNMYMQRKQALAYQIELEQQVQQRTEELSLAKTELEVKNEQMHENLTIAAEFQQALLNYQTEIPFLETAIKYIPHSDVSGDTYDLSLNREGDLNIFLGDATGHGIAAAFMTMMVQIGLDTVRSDQAPKDILRQINTLLASRETGKFLTGVYIRITPSGFLTVAHAGHPSIIIVPADGSDLVRFDKRANALGMFHQEKIPFVEETYQLTRGDRLFAYTDGLTEWVNPQKTLFGTQRLLQYFVAHRNQPLEILLSNLIATVEAFAQGVECGDDLTILGFQYQDNAK